MRLPIASSFVTSAAVVVLGLGLAAQGVQETEHVNRTIQLPAGGTLKLKNFSGSITITGTTGRNIVMSATRHATRDRLDHIKLAVNSSDSAVTIDANVRDAGWKDDDNKNVVETTFDLQVPSDAKLDIDTFSSHVTIRGVSGAQHLHTFSGGINVSGAKAVVERILVQRRPGRQRQRGRHRPGPLARDVQRPHPRAGRERRERHRAVRLVQR